MAEGLLEQYREKLRKAIGTARFFGLPDKPLDKVFVELTVIEDFEIPPDSEYKALIDKELRRRALFLKDESEEDEEGNPEESDDERPKRPRKLRRTVKPGELLEAGKRSQVVGAPGCGKTTLLRWLALRTIQTSDQLPVFIELKALKKAEIDTIEDDFPTFLYQHGVRKRFLKTDLTQEQFASLKTTFYKYFNEGRLVVLLDGLDEIAQEKRDTLKDIVENYANHRKGGLTLIISTRPYAYLKNFADLKAMEIEPLTDFQIGQFLDHWCEKPTAETVKANLRKNPNLRSLGRIPFLLAFIAHINSAGDITRIELYQQIIEQLIVEIDKEKRVERFKLDDPFGTTKRDFLRKVAFDRLFKGNKQVLSNRLVFTKDEFLKTAKEFVRNENLTINPAHLVFDVWATPLIREIENQRYVFSHLTIQEFLAAEELSKLENQQIIFTQAYFDRSLAETEILPMYIGLCNTPHNLLDLLLKLPDSIDFIGLRILAKSLTYHEKELNPIFYKNLNAIILLILSKAGKEEKRVKDLNTVVPEGMKHFLRLIFSIFGEAPNIYKRQLIDTLKKSLNRAEESLKLQIIESLIYIGDRSHKTEQEFLKITESPSHRQKKKIRELLNQLNKVPSKIIYEFKTDLGSKNKDARNNATLVFASLIKNSKISNSFINECLGDFNLKIREGMIKSIHNSKVESDEIINFLLQLTEDQEQNIRLETIKTLGSMKNDNHKIDSILINSLIEEDYIILKTSLKYLQLRKKISINNYYLNFLFKSDNPFKKSSTKVISFKSSMPEDIDYLIFDFLYGEERASLEALSFLRKIGFESQMLFDFQIEELKRAVNSRILSLEAENSETKFQESDDLYLPFILRSIGYQATSIDLMYLLQNLSEIKSSSYQEAAADAYNKYKFKLEMLGLLPA